MSSSGTRDTVNIENTHIFFKNLEEDVDVGEGVVGKIPSGRGRREEDGRVGKKMTQIVLCLNRKKMHVSPFPVCLFSLYATTLPISTSACPAHGALSCR